MQRGVITGDIGRARVGIGAIADTISNFDPGDEIAVAVIDIAAIAREIVVHRAGVLQGVAGQWIAAGAIGDRCLIDGLDSHELNQ